MKKFFALFLLVSSMAYAVDTGSQCQGDSCTFRQGKLDNAHCKQIVNKNSDAKGTDAASINSEGAVIELTEANFTDFVSKAQKPVVVDFYATWCEPCKAIRPFLEEIAVTHNDWIVASIDVDKAQATAKKLGIKALPTCVIFKNGEQWAMVQGARQKEQFIQAIEQIVAMDAAQRQALIDVEKKTIIMQYFIQALQQNNIDEVKRHIADGIDVNDVLNTSFGAISPIQVAISSGEEALIDILVAAGATLSEDSIQVLDQQLIGIEQSIEEIKVLVESVKTKIANAKPVNTKSENRSFQMDIAFIQAFDQARTDDTAFKKLIDESLDVNGKTAFNGTEVTPLYFAMLTKNSKAIDLLVAAGARLDTEITSEKGKTCTVEQKVQNDIAQAELMLIKVRQNFAYAIAHNGRK